MTVKNQVRPAGRAGGRRHQRMIGLGVGIAPASERHAGHVGMVRGPEQLLAGVLAIVGVGLGLGDCLSAFWRAPVRLLVQELLEHFAEGHCHWAMRLGEVGGDLGVEGRAMRVRIALATHALWIG